MPKPLCNCGNELIYFEGIGLEKGYKITSEGKRYKKPFYRDEGGSEFQGLACEKCENQYEVEENEQGFLVKGEAINQGFQGKYW